MSDLTVLGIDFEFNSVESFLDQVLSSSDIRIIEAITQITVMTGKSPTASEILKELSKTNSLKKTQLYERLNHLNRFGFITVRILPRPRRYITNRETITEGVEKWIAEQMASIDDISSELESMRQMIKQTKPEEIVTALVEKLSSDTSSLI